MTSALKFQDPPARGNNGSHHEEMAKALRSEPGRWALLAEAASSNALATNIKGGAIKAYRPSGSFESTTRSVKTADGKQYFDIYARFIGDDGEYA